MRFLKHLWRLRPFEIHRRRPGRRPPKSRIEYQRKYIDFHLQSGDRVLDIGSGHVPLPEATVLTDRFLNINIHRPIQLRLDGRPFIASDIAALPFRDRCFDFAYCSHVLEHVDDPEKSCAEIMRVANRGYIEAPAWPKDLLFARAASPHRWNVLAHGNTLHFFEYTERQRRGIGSAIWSHLVHGDTYHPLQDAFYENLDLFNTMFLWRDTFTCMVHRLEARNS